MATAMVKQLGMSDKVNSEVIFAASEENLSLAFPIRSDTNQTVQPEKMARG